MYYGAVGEREKKALGQHLKSNKLHNHGIMNLIFSTYKMGMTVVALIGFVVKINSCKGAPGSQSITGTSPE